MNKVETINDSYMVASGLPVKNGNKHAAEIATMALDLMAGSGVFIIPHRPTEKLQLRLEPSRFFLFHNTHISCIMTSKCLIIVEYSAKKNYFSPVG